MDLPLPLQGSQVQSFVGELRSGKPCGSTKKKKKKVYICRASKQERVRSPCLVPGPRTLLSLSFSLVLSFLSDSLRYD